MRVVEEVVGKLMNAISRFLCGQVIDHKSVPGSITLHIHLTLYSRHQSSRRKSNMSLVLGQKSRMSSHQTNRNYSVQIYIMIERERERERGRERERKREIPLEGWKERKRVKERERDRERER